MSANELVVESFNFRVWGTIATTISDKKKPADYKKELFEWCRFLGAAALGTEEAARAITNATPLSAKLYLEVIKNRPGRPSHEPDPERDCKVAPSTVRKILWTLRSFYNDLQEEGLVMRNPIPKSIIPEIAYRKRMTQCLPYEMVKPLLMVPGSMEHLAHRSKKRKDGAAPPISAAMIMRERAIISAFFGGALRRHEVTNLRVGDVKLSEKGTPFVYLRETKKGRDADQVIAKWAAAYIGAWRDIRVENGAQPNDFLFPAMLKDGKRCARGISDNQVYKNMKEYFECVGLNPRHYSPHSARVTSIDRLIDSGKRPHEVQNFSRHASIEMVYYYFRRKFAKEESPALELEFPGME